jgi:integrase
MQFRLAQSTRINYESHWKLFFRWCEAAKLEALPAAPQTVKDFMTWCLEQGYRTASVARYVAGIGHKHRTEELPDPTCEGLYNYLTRARRALQERPQAKAAITYELLRRVTLSFRSNPLGIRDRTMILLTFAAGWRRSEVIALQYEHAQFTPDGLLLFQARSKTDQLGEGRFVGVHRGRKHLTCPVRALEEWIAIRGDWPGPLFCRLNSKHEMVRKALHPRADAIYYALKEALAELGVDPVPYGAHSLRAGMVTEASKSGASEVAIKLRTGHRDMKVMQKYIRPVSAFDFNPLKNVL